MDVNIEELKTVLETKPELKEQLLSIVSDGRIVRTKEEDQQFLDNHVNVVVGERVKKELQPLVNEEYGKMMASIDGLLENTFGSAKKPGEKTFDFAKRTIEEKHAKGGDPITKETVKQLEELLGKSKSDSEKLLTDLNAKYERQGVENKLDAHLSTKVFPLPAHLLTEEEKQAYTNGQRRLLKQDFLSSFNYKKDGEGNTIFYQGEKPLLSQRDAKALGVESILDDKYSPWFLPSGTTQTGTGTGAGGAGAGGGFKDKDSVHRHLAASGMDAGSKEYRVQFEKLTKENNIAF